MLSAVLLLLSGCSGAGSPSIDGAGGQAEAWFVERTAETGIDFTYRSGGVGGMHIPEITGGGVALFDADSDGTLSQAEIEGAAAKLKALDQSPTDELRGAISFGRGGPGGLGRGPRGAQATTGQFNAPPLPNDDGEEKILAALTKQHSNCSLDRI